jgi:hypothetical protein
MTGRFQDRTWSDALDVPVVMLAELAMDVGTPDFIKIDVEGYEHPVLKGLHVAPSALSFEFAREFIGTAEACVARCVELGMHEFSVATFDVEQLAMPWTRDTRAVLARAVELCGGDIYARKVSDGL